MMRQDLARAMESLTPEGVSYRIAAPTFWGFNSFPALRIRPKRPKRRSGLQLNFADLNCGLCVRVVANVAGDFRYVRFKGGLEGLDRLEGQMPHRQKGRGRACHKASHSFLHINPFEGRAGQATHKRDVLREVVLHVENLPLAVWIQDADSDHVPSFKTVMAFPSCSTRLIPCVSRRVNWVVHLIRGVWAKWWQPQKRQLCCRTQEEARAWIGAISEAKFRVKRFC